MKLLHRLWLKINDIGEYDVKYGAWKIYQIMYTNNLIKGGNLFTDNDIVKKGGRPYIKCQFIHNGKSTAKRILTFLPKRKENYVEADMKTIKKF